MRLSVLIFFFWILLIGHVMASNEKIVYGYIEKATLVSENLTLSAKLDTGAKSASLNATHISKIDVDGKPYLRFFVPSKEGDILFKCEYAGDVHIKARTGERQADPLLRQTIKRPVVLMKIKIANKERVIRVNLTNRKHFTYPLLLGREAIIAFNGIIDPSLKYTIKAQNMDAE
ncbi:ATP-dependent zinc protease [Legionella nagasakiensis]|uniref:ATP-dependent zinc protease family protein n=1 Tax=Legionella nagasakiensis TaxID=535290 RepID=UPI0013EFBC7A|nr:RimK/LysX family protein [Legionella nagasakiensis]